MQTEGGAPRASELRAAALNRTLPQLQAVCFALKPRARNVPSDVDCRSNQQSSDRNQTHAGTRLQAAAALMRSRVLAGLSGRSRGGGAVTVLKGSLPGVWRFSIPPHPALSSDPRAQQVCTRVGLILTLEPCLGERGIGSLNRCRFPKGPFPSPNHNLPPSQQLPAPSFLIPLSTSLECRSALLCA